MASSRRVVKLAVASIVIVVLGGVFIVAKPFKKDNRNPVSSGSQVVRTEGEPRLTTETIAEGLSNIWDVAQAPDKTIFYTERSGKIGAVLGGKSTIIYEPEDVVVRGEGGMLGMTLDSQFDSNRYLYTCFNTVSDIRVVRFKVTQDNQSLGERKDIVTGLPVNASGRHSGCRPRFDPNNHLWIGTGDTARSIHPQSPSSLGGKILRVDRDGTAVPGNLGSPFDPRIYSYGHRNVQGLAFYAKPRGEVIGYSIEHGSDRDDEVNTLKKGNFGWDPDPGYDESVEMTDTKKFPNAIRAVWSSGRPTIAPSGGTILEGKQWKEWEGRLMMAVQKDKHVRLLGFDQTGSVLTGEERLLDQFGRIRSVVMGTDGSAYLTTDNGGGEDKIIKVTPN